MGLGIFGKKIRKNAQASFEALGIKKKNIYPSKLRAALGAWFAWDSTEVPA